MLLKKDREFLEVVMVDGCARNSMINSSLSESEVKSHPGHLSKTINLVLTILTS